MLRLHAENIGEIAVIECQGRIVRSDAAFKLRDAVKSQGHVRVIVLDLSEVHAIEGGGLGMLRVLQQWAHDHDIRLTLFDPSPSVRDRLAEVSSMQEFEISTFDEVMALLAHANFPYANAA